MLKTKKQTKKGITLISLVITVIILLILATVAITAAIDGNGLFLKANQAKEEMRYSQIKEAKDLWEINTEADRYSEEKIAGTARDVINKLYEQGTITEEERDKLIDGETIIVANKEISFIQENQLYLTLSKTYAENYQYAVIYYFPKIGGIPELIPYEEYIKPEEVLATKDDAGKEEIFLNFYKYNMKDYFESYYPGQEITLDFLLSLMGVANIGEVANMMGYNTVDEMIIAGNMIGYAEYDQYYNNYNASYKKNITITRPNGTTQTVSTSNISSTGYAVLENGTYTFTATMEGQEVSKSIDITDIQQYSGVVLGKEDENTYIINCIEDLIKLSESVKYGTEYEGKTVKLMRNLDFNEDSSYENPTDVTTFGDYNKDGVTEGIKTEVTKVEQRGFVPIGGESFWIPETYQTLQYYFKGTLEGNNYTISNLYINNNSIYSLGLFAKNYGTIQNLNLDGNITANNTNYSSYYVGGFAGYNYGTIKNCENNVKFTTNVKYLNLGGITGYNSGARIENCKNISDFNFAECTNMYDAYIGGIAGHNDNAYIGECENNANITVEESAGVYSCEVGGIYARSNQYNALTINCKNLGKIEMHCLGAAWAGGIAASFNTSGRIYNCVNIADIQVSSDDELRIRRYYRKCMERENYKFL